jgi:uncharacterized BrkB/YihY/UPF0761 family membrane protein
VSDLRARPVSEGAAEVSFLDIFALIVLLVLAVTLIVLVGVLGALPGRIARRRKHPQADAIAVGGWLGLLFFGVLWPLAMIWAYTRIGAHSRGAESASASMQGRAA